VIAVAPELGVGIAVKEYFQACRDLKQVKDRWPELEVDRAHAFYAMMGGFAEDANDASVHPTSYPMPQLLEAPPLSKTGGDKASESVKSAIVSVVSPLDHLQPHARASEMPQASSSDFEKLFIPPIYPKLPLDLRPLCLYSYGRFSFLSDSSLAEILKFEQTLQEPANTATARICQNPSSETTLITKQDIEDRSKTDAFTKIFAIAQASWLIVESIARISSGLPLSLLELATIAYIIPAAVMYGFWWEKPFGVEHITVIHHYSGTGPESDPWAKTSLIDNVIEDVLGVSSESWKQNLAFYTVATLFSAVHLGAWNWEFPSPVARLLWRIFGVFATAAGPYSVVILLSFKGIEYSSYGKPRPIRLLMWVYKKILRIFGIITKYFIWPLYVISRCVLLGLTIYSFSSMPIRVYMTID